MTNNFKKQSWQVITGFIAVSASVIMAFKADHPATGGKETHHAKHQAQLNIDISKTTTANVDASVLDNCASRGTETTKAITTITHSGYE